MQYAVYNIETTKLVCKKRSIYHNTYGSKGAATRVRNQQANPEDFAIAEAHEFFANIEKLVERTNSMTGKKFQEPVNTPYACSPSSEAYWCS